MKALLLLAFACACASAQSLTFSIHDPSGQTPDTPLSANYQFASTPQGSSSTIMVKLTNSGSSAAEIILVYVGNTAGSAAATANFSVTGFDEGNILAPGSSMYFNVNFIPAISGNLTGYLQAAYVEQESGCVVAGATAANQCPSTISPVSTLMGTATDPQIVLSYAGAQGSTTLQPATTTNLDFGNVSVSASNAITFTLSNETSASVATPTVALQTQVFNSSAFSIDISKLPATLPANGSGTFTVTFAPGQTGYTSASITVGANSYGIQGTGIVVADIDALQISYLDSTGVRISPQAATAIDFGQLVPGTGTTAALAFTVTNPTTSFNAVSLASVTLTGSAFTLSGAPSFPASIAPGSSITFTVTFAAGSASGTSTGTLAIGTRNFSLTGLAVVSPVPSPSLQLSQSVLTSQQQVTVSVNFSAAASQSAIGELSLAFTPSVANVSDDPAIVFLATSGRQLQLNLASGATSATYNNQSAISFQTGTTAGTLTFTVTFPNTTPYKQSFTITPAQIYLSPAQGVSQTPNLVITLNGYDNTYSVGKMSFTFYDTSGKVITPNGVNVDGTSDFHNYFFTNNQAGGAFSLQATFPTTGDITQVGSADITLTNSVGQTTSKVSFQ